MREHCSNCNLISLHVCANTIQDMEHAKKREITERQAEVLRWIEGYVASKKFPPSQREIAEGMGYANQSGVIVHLAALERKGYIRRTRDSQTDRPVPRGLVILKPAPQDV